jgi:hypothetical protein
MIKQIISILENERKPVSIYDLIIISILSFFTVYIGFVMLYKEKLNDKANSKHIGK